MGMFFNTNIGSYVNFTTFLILLIAVVINIIVVIKNSENVKKYKSLYEEALSRFNSKENIEDEFLSIYNRLNDVEKQSEDVKISCEKIQDMMKKHVQKIGLVKYNAYEGTESKFSFALSLLDHDNNGIIMDYIYSSHGSNTYIKSVTNGEVKERISEEEAVSLRNAIEDKNYVGRNLNLVEAQTIRTKKPIKRAKKYL